jgi:F420-non-reducing hydrogenase iron-sulfur subunit
MQYPPNIRIVRVMCSASVSPHFILRAFQGGVDGVFVSGCRFGDCHYLYGNYSSNKRVQFLKQLLAFCGLDAQRLKAHWGSSAEAPELVSAIKGFVDTLKTLGPSPLNKRRGSETQREAVFRECSDAKGMAQTGRSKSNKP